MPEGYETKIRPDKVAAVEEIKGDLERAETIVLTEYRGLSVSQLAELRQNLADADARYRVVKNSLARLAARELGWNELDDLFAGPTALAYCYGDPVVGAKALTDFADEHPALVIKGGVLEGRIISGDEAQGLAKVDPLEVSLGKINRTLTSAAQAMVMSLQSALRSIAFTLQQVAEAGESGPLGGTAEPETAEPDAAEEASTEDAASAEEPPEEEAATTEAAEAPAEAEAPEAEAEAPEADEAGDEAVPEAPEEDTSAGDAEETEDEDKEGA